MNANLHFSPQNKGFSIRFSRAVPLAVTLLVWLFAASLETGYVAVLNSGIQQQAVTAA